MEEFAIGFDFVEGELLYSFSKFLLGVLCTAYARRSFPIWMRTGDNISPPSAGELAGLVMN